MRDRPSRVDRQARRLREIAGVAVRYGLADQLRRMPGKRLQQWLRGTADQDLVDLTVSARIRFALSELGTTFIKFGQMLSTRADLIGKDLARELMQLQAGTPPDPPGLAETTIRKELGRTPDTIFASFDPVPFASASIAQVHHARLHSGEHVVVKIQKDGIEERVETDLDILATLAQLAERHVAELRPYHPIEVVAQFTKMMRGELDFRREMRNILEFRHNFASDPMVHFPVPHPDLCTRRVLTMERLDGVLLSQIEVFPGPSSDIDEFARRGANMYLEMIFRDAFCHADPHPGNLMLLPDGIVGVLDCGMVQRLDDDLRDGIEDLLLAVGRGDARAVTDAVWDLCTSPPPVGRRRLESDITDFLADYSNEMLRQGDMGELLRSLSDVIHRNHVFLPPGASLLLRLLVELEGTARLLNPSFRLAELIQPYAGRAARRRFAPARLWQETQRTAREWERLARGLPGDITDVVQGLRAGTLSVHLEHRRLDPVVNRLVLGLLAASLLLGSSLLWSLHAAPLVWGVSLFGGIGYVLAFTMGMRLLRTIARAEREHENG